MPPLLEFVVTGTPVSHRGKARRKRKWMASVEDSAREKWKNPPMKSKLKCTLIHFHKGGDAPLDNDNMAKPVHDAMEAIVYDNDNQLIHTDAIQTSIDSPLAIEGASKLLLDAIAQGEDFLYIRFDEPPNTIRLPR
jgi:hypothetical protein